MDNVRIRAATPVDAGAITRVHIASWQTSYRGIVSDMFLDRMSDEVPRRQQLWLERLMLPPGELHIAVAENSVGQVVGFAVGGSQHSAIPDYDGELHALYLLKEAQRAGTGRRLVRDVAHRMVDSGLRSMVAWVLTENHAARRFYEALDGQLVSEDSFELDGQQLDEVAYAWPDLAVLASDGSGSV